MNSCQHQASQNWNQSQKHQCWSPTEAAGSGNVTYQIAQTRQSSNAPKIVVDLLDGWFNPLKLHTRCKQQKQLDECFSVPNVPTHLKLIANLDEKRLLHWDMNPVAYLSFVTFDSFIYIWFHSMWLFFVDQSFCVVAAFLDFPGDRLFIWSTHGDMACVSTPNKLRMRQTNEFKWEQMFYVRS